MSQIQLASREDRLRSALSEWLGTPAHLREHRELGDLAEALGLPDAAELLALGAGDAEWNQQMLQATASLVMTEMPSVLATLVASAKAGSTRATEVLLDWLRKTIQSHPSQAPALGSGGSNVHNTLVMLSQGAGSLADLVASLGSSPDDAAQRMEDWRSQQALSARARTTMLLDQTVKPARVDYVGVEADEESPFYVERGRPQVPVEAQETKP
jgi:hypothetical protein